MCNGVCNWFGHNLARPGTTWHNREAAEPPQAPTRGTPGHFLAQRGTTWHKSPPCLRVLQGLPLLLANSGENRGFGEVGFSSVQSSVQWPWSQPGTTWHNRVDGMTGPGAPRTRLGAYHAGPRVPARRPHAPRGAAGARAGGPARSVAVPAAEAAKARATPSRCTSSSRPNPRRSSAPGTCRATCGTDRPCRRSGCGRPAVRPRA